MTPRPPKRPSDRTIALIALATVLCLWALVLISSCSTETGKMWN